MVVATLLLLPLLPCCLLGVLSFPLSVGEGRALGGDVPGPAGFVRAPRAGLCPCSWERPGLGSAPALGSFCS